MDRATLADLRLEWVKAVLLNPHTGNPLSCWFGHSIPGIDGCEGGLEGAHWIKRRRAEEWVKAQLGRGHRYDLAFDPDLVLVAAWDPRNGVPACEKHHRRFDGHRVDATNELVIWRHEVPAHVEAFAADWGLEHVLEQRHPPIGVGA